MIDGCCARVMSIESELKLRDKEFILRSLVSNFVTNFDNEYTAICIRAVT